MAEAKESRLRRGKREGRVEALGECGPVCRFAGEAARKSLFRRFFQPSTRSGTSHPR